MAKSVDEIIEKILQMKEIFIDSLYPENKDYLQWIDSLDLDDDVDFNSYASVSDFSRDLRNVLYPSGRPDEYSLSEDNDELGFYETDKYDPDKPNFVQDYKLAISRLIKRSLKQDSSKGILPHDAVIGKREPMQRFLSDPKHENILEFLKNNIDRLSGAHKQYLSFLHTTHPMIFLTTQEREQRKLKAAQYLKEARDKLKTQNRTAEIPSPTLDGLTSNLSLHFSPQLKPFQAGKRKMSELPMIDLASVLLVELKEKMNIWQTNIERSEAVLQKGYFGDTQNQEAQDLQNCIDSLIDKYESIQKILGKWAEKNIQAVKLGDAALNDCYDLMDAGDNLSNKLHYATSLKSSEASASDDMDERGDRKRSIEDKIALEDRTVFGGRTAFEDKTTSDSSKNNKRPIESPIEGTPPKKPRF